MTRTPGPLRRYALPLTLLAALAWVFVRWTLPALQDLRSLRRDANALESDLEAREDAAEAKRALRIGATEDPLTIERLELEARLSPDVVGPIFEPIEVESDDDDDAAEEPVGDGEPEPSDT